MEEDFREFEAKTVDEAVILAMKTLHADFEDLDIKEVVVDFKPWDTERFMQFDQYRRDGKFDRAEAMLPEVVKWDKLSTSDERVSFTVGATCYKAINEAYKQIVSGKN